MRCPVGLKNENGNLTLSIILSMAILAALGASISFTEVQMRGNSSMVLDRGLRNIEYRVRGWVQNEIAWEKTLAAAANAVPLDCLIDVDPPIECKADNNDIDVDVTDPEPDYHASEQIVIYDGDNNIVYDATSATSGFTFSGEVCNAFDGAAGNDDCPFKLKFNLTTECYTMPGGPACSVRGLAIEGSYEFRPTTSLNMGTVNFRNRGFVISRRTSIKVDEATCVASSGVWDDVVDDCKIKLPDFTCPAGKAINAIIGESWVCVDI